MQSSEALKMDPSHCPIVVSVVNRAILVKFFACANLSAAPEVAIDWLDFLVVASFFQEKNFKKLKNVDLSKTCKLVDANHYHPSCLSRKSTGTPLTPDIDYFS